jgi:hypothetical protein
MNLSVRYIAAIGFRLREFEREVIFAPNHQQPRLLLTNPCLPLRVGVNVRAVVIEKVALNIHLTGLAKKGKFIGPEILVIAFRIRIVPDMARPRRRQREQICAKRTFVGSAIGPEGPPGLPIRPQTFVVRNGVLND